MRFCYDEEGDVLEVIFDERLHRNGVKKTAFKLRLGIVLYLTADSMKLVQLTLVSYRGLAQFPVVHFDGWQKLPAADKKRLLPVLNSAPVSAFLRINPKTGDGHISSPAMLEILPVAA
jgi:hypothetical protein